MLKKYIFLFYILTLWGFSLKAQENVLYQFNKLPQAIKLNPAYQPDCKLFIGLPVLSNLSFGYDNNAFNYNQIFDRTGDSIRINLADLSKNLDLYNHIRLSFATDILSIGYKYNDMYFMFNFGQQTFAGISFPRAIVDLVNGNWNTIANVPIQHDFSVLGINAQSYNNISISASKPINRKLTAGIRLSYLKGIANLNNQNRHLSLLTNAYPISLTALINSQINAAGFFTIQIPDSIGQLPKATIDNSQIGVMQLLFPKNNGFSMDIGIQFHYSDVLTFNASLRNLGFIKWKTNPSNVLVNGAYVFNGINFDDYIAGGQSTGNVIQSIKDSLLNSFTYTSTNESYNKALPMHFMFEADYKLNDKTNIDMLVHALIYDQMIEFSATAGISYQLLKKLRTNLSFSYLNSSFNAGGGLVFGAKNINFFILTENLPIRYAKLSNSPLLVPYSAQTVNLQFGLNLKFGCNKTDKIKGQSNSECPAFGSPYHPKTKKKSKKR
jgi:hypothetical protein